MADQIIKPASYKDLRALRIMIHGLSESGKSMAALSASTKWPKDAFRRTKKSKKVKLDDLVYWDIDGDGHIGLLQHNIEPTHRIDFRQECADYGGDVSAAMDGCVIATTDLIDQDKDKHWFVVVDALSTLDELLYAWYGHPKRILTSEKTGKPDGFAPYRFKLAVMNDFEFSMSMLGPNVTVIYTAHTQTLNEESARTDEQKERVRQKRQNDVSVNKIPNISGKCNDLFLNRVSFEFNFHKVVRKGAKAERFMYAETYGGYRGKNRLPDVIKGEQPPLLNPILKKIFATLTE